MGGSILGCERINFKSQASLNLKELVPGKSRNYDRSKK